MPLRRIVLVFIANYLECQETQGVGALATLFSLKASLPLALENSTVTLGSTNINVEPFFLQRNMDTRLVTVLTL